MEKQKRSSYIDAVKGYAILLVMLGHCIVLNSMEDGIIYDAIKAVQMPLFMALSGYVAGAYMKISSGAQLWSKLLKRAVSYLVPFFIWIAILHPRNILESIGKVMFQLDKGLWFLMVLFLMTFTMYIAIYFRQNKKHGVILFWVIWLLFSALLLIQYKSRNRFLSPHLTVFYLPFYIGGYLAALYAGRVSGLLEHHINKISVSAFLLFMILIIKFDMVTAQNTLEMLVQLAAGALGCLFSSCLVYRLKDGKLNAFLAYIGQYTIEIYVLHYHFATLLGLKEKNLNLYSAEGIVWVIAVFVLMSFLTWISIAVLKRFWLTDFLLFGKSVRSISKTSKYKV